MNHDLYKMLFDRNPDGSVSYSVEDMEIITEEDNNAQVALRNLILQDYTVLLEEIRRRIAGIATFAYDDEKKLFASHLTTVIVPLRVQLF